MSVRDYLGLLFGGRPGKLIISHSDPRRAEQGKRPFVGKTLCSDDLDAVAAKIAELDAVDEIESVYVRMSTVREDPGRGKRGGAYDTYASVGLFGDADFGALGHSADNLPADAGEARKLVEKAGLPSPSLVVNSGGGLYPIWLLDPAESVIEDHAEYERLSKRWNNVIGAAAAASGLHYDAGVGGDIARVLRVAGTENRKEPLLPRPCAVVELSGQVFSRAELLAAVEEAEAALGVSAVPALVRESGEEIDVLEAVDASRHVFHRFAAETSWPELMAGRFGWDELDPESGEEFRFRRPGATSEYSAKVLEVEPHVLVVWSDSCGLPTGAGQKLTKGRVLAHLEFDGDEYAATVALEEQYGQVGDDLEPFDLFEQTDILRHIRQAAHSTRASAPALLNYVLCRVLAELPPYVTLPPMMGAESGELGAPLNLGGLAVAGSGGGKSTLLDLSLSLLGDPTKTYQAGIQHPLGTGEGIAQSYLYFDKSAKPPVNVLVDDPRGVFIVDEMQSLEGIRSRSGSTVGGQMRSALTGGWLGSKNADAERSRTVPSKSYRFVLLGGIHPEHSDIFLTDDEIHRGTPQRFIWEMAVDPTLPRVRPEWPGALNWQLPGEFRMSPGERSALIDFADEDEDAPPYDPTKAVYIEYPEEISAEMDEYHWKRSTGQIEEGLTGHLYLTRLKVGAALALLHGETYISQRWWELAGGIVSRSLAVQEYCLDAMRKKAQKESVIRAQAAGRAEVVKQDAMVAETARRERMAEQIVDKVVDAGEEGISWSRLRKSIHAPSRVLADELRDKLVGDGKIRAEEFEYKGQHGVKLYSV